MHQLVAADISKRFGSHKVLSNISISLSTGESVALTGANGSGKTTLLMLLMANMRPTHGQVIYSSDDHPMPESQIRRLSALVSPYLNLYDHLTAEENLRFFSVVSGARPTGKQINVLLARVGLDNRGADQVRTYSSGMKQRLKYALALLKEPVFLFLDEPTANLDENGRQMVSQVVDEFRSKAIVILATNEKEEYRLASRVVALSH